MRSLRAVTVTGTLVVLLAGCGSASTSAVPISDAPTTTTAAAAAAPPSDAAAPTAPAPTGPEDLTPTTAKGAAATVTATGTVTAGVEAGCKLLTAGATTYLLQGAAAVDAHVGDTVTVQGHLDPTLLSYCQQGQLLVVTAVRR